MENTDKAGMSDRRDWGLLALLCTVITIANQYWISQETRPPHWDMARHLWTSLLYWEIPGDLRHFYRMWTNYYYYPPLRYWLTLPYYLMFGKTIPVAVFSNTLYVFLLAFSTYGIGKRVWNRATGLLAALFVLCSPMYVSQFKEYQLDAQQGTMVALSFYLFLRTEGFRNGKFSNWFGISLGLGMLTKWTFGFCLGLPVLWEYVQVLFGKDLERESRLKNAHRALLIGSGISLIWYANHPRMLFNDLFSWTQKSDGGHYFEGYTFWFYPRVLETFQLYLIPSLFFLVGMVFTFKSKENRDRNRDLFLLVVGNYSMTFIKLDVRYTMPVVVGISVLAVFWIFELKKPLQRWLAGGAVTAYCSFAFWAISFGVSFLPADLSWGGVELFAQRGYLVGPPIKEQWHLEEIYKLIATYPEAERELGYDGPGSYSLNSWDFYYYSKLYGIPFKSDAEKPMFFVLRGNEPLKAPEGYRVLKTYDLPDGGKAGLFRKKS